MALALEHDALLIDLDGVVWLGSELIPGAVDAIDSLMAHGVRIVFVTNDARSPAGAHAERLRAAGLDVSERDIVTSAGVTAKLAADSERGGPAFVIGTRAFRDEVTGAGIEILGVEDGGGASLVLVGGDHRFGYAELRCAVSAVIGGASLYASNRDRTLPMPDGLWPGTGAIVAAIEYATGATATIGGKPERHLFDLALAQLGEVERPAMVGDRLDSDIAGARAAGLETILVLSGATSAQELERSETKPDRTISSIAELWLG